MVFSTSSQWMMEYTWMWIEEEADSSGSAKMITLSSKRLESGSAVIALLLSLSSSIWMSKGSSRGSRFRLFACGVLRLSASFALMWLHAQDAYALVAHHVIFQLPSQYLKKWNSGSFSISLLKYIYVVSLAFPQEEGANPFALIVCQSLRAFCPTLMRVSRRTADPSIFSKYGCGSLWLSDFQRGPLLFSWVARPSVSPVKLSQYNSNNFAVQKRTWE